MTFSISAEQSKKIDDWLYETVFPPIIEQQRQNPDIAAFLVPDENGRVHPYEGAIGGGITYSFTPTSLGTIVKVSYGEHELDLTDYDFW